MAFPPHTFQISEPQTTPTPASSPCLHHHFSSYSPHDTLDSQCYARSVCSINPTFWKSHLLLTAGRDYLSDTSPTTRQTLVLVVAGSISSWFAMNSTKQMHIAEGYRKRDRELYAIQTAQKEFHAKYRTTTGTAEASASQEKSF